MLLISIVLLSHEEARPCLRDELRDRKGYQILHSTHLSGLDLRGTLVLLLAALNFLLFFPLFFSTPFLPTKYSLEQGPKTSDGECAGYQAVGLLVLSLI